MGISSINCKGRVLYAENGESGCGEEARNASDFDGEYLLKAGVVVLGGTLAGSAAFFAADYADYGACCIDTESFALYSKPLSQDAKYEPGRPLGTGTITAEYNRSGGYELLATKHDFMFHFTDNIAIAPFKNDDAINFCRIIDPDAHPLACIKPVKTDGIEMGDRVAVYEANEVK